MRHFKSAIASTSLLVFPVLLMLVPNQAIAEKVLSGLYAGGFYSDSSQELESRGVGLFERSRGHMKIKIGTAINDYLDVEGQFGVTSDISSNEGLMTYGAYLRLNKEFGDNKYKVYGLAGFSGVEDNYSVTDLSASGASFGGGIEIFGGKNLSLGIEFIRLFNAASLRGGDLTTDVLGFGVTYYFLKETSVFDRNRDKIESIRY